MHTHTLVFVAGDLISAVPAPDVLAVKSIREVIDGLRVWIVTILAAVATLFLAISGLQRMTAAGDTGQNEQAKNNFKNALIGYALAILAPVFLEILQGILGVSE